uniref:Neuronal acetylcholine receptor subunit alpha-6 n=2 Tax=Culex pipiens TaxID=7175 RepID=A0A8D8BPZ9_CULPI
MWPLAILALFRLLAVGSAESKYNVTYADLDKCKQFNAVNGYNYDAFFKLTELDNHNLDNETIVNLRLFVVASKDAHILLSDIDSVIPEAQVYEIVVGAGGNMFTEIRRQRKKNPLKTKTTKNVLSPIDPLPLRIRLTTEGLIEVGIEGQDLPLISATDKNVTSVRYLSFSSWGSTQAKWFYDCETEDETVTELEVYDPTGHMTPKDKLIYALQMNASYRAPDWETPIEMQKLVFTRIAYDSWKNQLETRLMFRLSWRDNRSCWEPKEHSNITKVINFSAMLWAPAINVKDEKDYQLAELIGTDHFTVTYDGQYEWISREITTDTFCALSSSDDWPYETNTCDVAFSSDLASTPLRFLSDAVSLHPNLIQSDWIVERITKHDNLNEEEIFLFNDGSPRPEVVLRLHIKRNNEFYDTVLYAPYFMTNVMILVSFWMEGIMRIFANSLGVILLIGTFLQMSAFVPQLSSPKIFTFFRCTLYCSWICVLLFVLDKWLRKYGPKMAPDSWLARLVSYPHLRFVLRLDGGSHYGSLHQKNLEWRDFAKMLDRVVFIVMSGIFLASCFVKL